MAGWHTRFWRRVRIAPGVTINLSKSGASVSVGPRGAKLTVGRRGVRQTLGIPGTGFYATRQLGGPPASRPAAPSLEEQAVATSSASTDLAADAAASQAPAVPEADDAAAPQATAPAVPEADDDIVLYFGLASVVGVLFGLALFLIGRPTSEALTGGAIAIVVGIVYEGLAHHHPGPAKAVAAVAVGVISIVTAVLAGLAIAVIGGLLLGAAGSGRSRRRRRGSW